MRRLVSCATVEFEQLHAVRARRARVLLHLLAVAALGPGAALAVAGDAAAATAITDGGSIAFARDHNVWLTSTDGRVERPLTTDGTPSKPYRDPSQSADGRIVVAVRDSGEPRNVVSSLYEMDRQGTLLRVPFRAPQYDPGLDTTTCRGGVYQQSPTGVLAAVSPNGSKIAVNRLANTAFFSFCGFTGAGSISEVEVINVDGSPANGVIQPLPGASRFSLTQPSWASDDRLLLKTALSEGDVYYDLGSARAQPWIAASDIFDGAYGFPVLSADTRMLATAGYSGGIGAGLSGYRPRLRLWTTNGAIPARPTPRCDIVSPNTLTIAQITIAPDGAGVAWAEEERDGAGQLTATAIHISPIGDISTGNCGSLDRQLLIAGGRDPDWGAAPVGPAGSSPTLPVCPPDRPGTPPECGATPAAACPTGQVGNPPSCTTPAASCPAGQVGTPPSCTTPAASCPAGTAATPPDCVAPSGTAPPSQQPVSGPAAPRTTGSSSRTITAVVNLRRGCTRLRLRVSGRGVKVDDAKPLPRSRCQLTLQVAAGLTGRRDLLVTRGKRTTRLRGVIRL